METFSSYNKKLAGYKDVSQTVKVIEKIAASDLHSTNRGIDALAQYTENIHILLSRIDSLQQEQNEIPTNTNSEQIKKLLVVVSGDKGLVGDMWKRLFMLCKKYPNQDILVIGKKGQDFFPQNSTSIKHIRFKERLPETQEVEEITKIFSNYIENNTYNRIDTVHVLPESLLKQTPVATQLLPIVVTQSTQRPSVSATGYPLIETPLHTLRATLYNKYLIARMRQVILETAVAEFSARTVAMEHAGTKTDEERELLSKMYSRDNRKSETQKQLERFASKAATI